MATIIAVHGTFSSGPEVGENWWQRGSEFEKEVHEYVEAEDGCLDFKPFAWSGENSEASRRESGSALLDAMKALDDAGRSFCLVGHSHGGSVIASSLLQAAGQSRPLAALSTWIVIGTPFLRFTPSRHVFSRLGNFGKAFYISIVTYIALLVLAILSFGITGKSALHPNPETFSIEDLVWAVSTYLLVPLILIYLCLYFLTIRLSSARAAKDEKRFDADFCPRIRILRHQNDEAIGGLALLGKTKYDLFAPNFAVSFISFSSVLILPVTILFLLLPIGAFEAYFDPALRGPEAKSLELADRIVVVLFFSWIPILHWLLPTAIMETFWQILNQFRLMVGNSMLGNIAVYAVGPVQFFLLSWLVVVAMVRITPMLSRILSIALNRLTRNEIKRSSVGGDVIGESGQFAGVAPGAAKREIKPLPKAIADEMSELSDREAAKVLSVLRQRIFLQSLGEAADLRGEELAKYLTWGELIHTTYFKIPLFRKLVCYEIAHSPGFRPSQSLKSDPDYGMLGQWSSEIEGNPAPSQHST